MSIDHRRKVRLPRRKRIHIGEEDQILIGAVMLICFGIPTGVILGPLIVVLNSPPPVLFYITCTTFALAMLGFIIGMWGFMRESKNRPKSVDQELMDEILKSLRRELLKL